MRFTHGRNKVRRDLIKAQIRSVFQYTMEDPYMVLDRAQDFLDEIMGEVYNELRDEPKVYTNADTDTQLIPVIEAEVPTISIKVVDEMSSKLERAINSDWLKKFAEGHSE